MNFIETNIVCIKKRLVLGKYLVEDCPVPEARDNCSFISSHKLRCTACSQSLTLVFKWFDIRRGKYTISERIQIP